MDKIEEGRERNECMSIEDRPNSLMTDISSWEMEDTSFSACPEFEKRLQTVCYPALLDERKEPV